MMLMMISHHYRERGKDNGLDRVSEFFRTYQCRRNHIFNLWLLQNQMMRYHMRILRSLIPHRHQLDHHHQLNKGIAPEDPKYLDQVSEYIHVHPRMLVNSNSLLYLLLQGYCRIATQSEDENSATVDPQNRVSNHSRSPQNQENTRRQGPQKPKAKKNTAEKQPRTPQKSQEV